MKSDIDLKEELYTDQIIPVYLLEQKLKANFVSIQRRFKESDQKSLNYERRISQLEKNRNNSITAEIQKIVTQKLLEFNENIGPSAFRKQITNQVETKFKEVKLDLPAQIRRESQSLITTELISIRRMIGEIRFDNGGEKGLDEAVREYEEQRNEKQITEMKSEISKLIEKVNIVSEQVEGNTRNFNQQISSILSNLGKIKVDNAVKYYSYQNDQEAPSLKQQQVTFQNVNQITNHQVELEQQISQIHSKLLDFVSHSEFELEARRNKQSMNTFSISLSLVTKQMQNNDEIHSLILKTNTNVQRIQGQYQALKSSCPTKPEIQQIVSASLRAMQSKIDEITQLFNKKINHVEKHKSSIQTKQINQMTERINQLERLNNYEEYMEKVQEVLDKHHVEEPPNPRKTLYMDYINHLEAKVENLSKDLKSLNQKIEIDAQGTKLMEVSKIDIEEVWKAIMILESIIQNKSELQSSRKKVWSTAEKADISASKNSSPNKERGSQTVYIRRTETHRAGGFGQKMGSSKNIKHLIDERPQRLEREKKPTNLIKLPELPKQQHEHSRN